MDLFSGKRPGIREGLLVFVLLWVFFVIVNPASADHELKFPDGSIDVIEDYEPPRDVHFYRRHWHSEDSSGRQPESRSQSVKSTRQQERLKDRERARERREIQNKDRGKEAERDWARWEAEEQERIKSLERERTQWQTQEKDRIKDLERERARREIRERDRIKDLERAKARGGRP
ncbi:MAG: hypothetical protein NPINA01_29460 [Nitrospinaceae bacterium]|nr:MAG: hypothetical protein NPINA01_29460 [Nitrospinaceae bacterium]